MTRRPVSLYGVGDDPDPRFSLANERTFLAWIRTSGALFALAVAIDAFDVELTDWVAQAVIVLLTLAALFGAVEAWRSWAATERALRLGQPLPARTPNLVIAFALAVVLVVFLVDVIVRGVAS